MADRSLECCSLLYVPNMLCNKSISVAVIFIDPVDIENGICTMAFATGWKRRVRKYDSYADLKMLDALLSEVRDRLLTKNQRLDMIYQLDHSFSNVIQVSQRQKCLVGPTPETINAVAQELLEKEIYNLSQLQAA